MTEFVGVRETRVGLTDDEVLALATRAGVAWPSVCPTVDVADSAALSVAVQRGVRSLIVRELLGVGGEDQLADPLDRVVGPLLRATPVLGIYPTTDELRYVSPGIATAYYRCNESLWVSEVITGAGIHYLKLNDPTACCAAAGGFLQHAVDTGWPWNSEKEPEFFLCAIGPRVATSVRFVKAQKGSISAHQTSTAGLPQVVTTKIGSPSEAIAYLLGDLATAVSRSDSGR